MKGDFSENKAEMKSVSEVAKHIPTEKLHNCSMLFLGFNFYYSAKFHLLYANLYACKVFSATISQI